MGPLTVQHFPELRSATEFSALISQIVAHPLVFHIKQCTDAEGLNVLVEGRQDGDRYVLQFVPDSAARHWALDHIDWYPRRSAATGPPAR